MLNFLFMLKTMILFEKSEDLTRPGPRFRSAPTGWEAQWLPHGAPGHLRDFRSLSDYRCKSATLGRDAQWPQSQ